MSGTLAFQRIPSSLRVPGTYIEIDPSNANAGQQNLRALVIGQVIAGSPAALAGTTGQPAISQGPAHAKARSGAGSMLALAVADFRARNSTMELWVLPLLDDPAGVAATGGLGMSGTPSVNSVLPLYIDGQYVPVLLTAGMSPTQMCGAINAAVTPGTPTDLPVTSTTSGTNVGFTAKNKGIEGNAIDIRLAYRGTQGGESVPDGVSVNLTPMSGGAVNPSLTVPLLSLGDMPFEVIHCPYSDSGSLDAMALLMNESTGRWAYNRKLYGHVYAAKRVNLAAATTFGVTRNDAHMSVLPMNNPPQSPHRIAAAYAAAVGESVLADPSIPLGRMPTNIMAPASADRFVYADRNALLFDGLSTYLVQQDGTVITERLVTTYQVNPAGVPDTSYLDCESMHTLGFVCRDLDYYLTSRFSRVKLVGDDVRIAGGSAMVNPGLIKSTLDTRYRYLCEVPAVVQDAAGFAKESSVTLAGQGRVNIRAPIRLMGQLRIMAILVDFTKPT